MSTASRSVTEVDDDFDLETGGALALDDGDEQSNARPEFGPYDEDELDLEATDPFARYDFGALRLPVPPGGTVVLEPTESGHPQAVHIALPHGRLSVSALAAPRSQQLWPELSREIAASLREGGARVWTHTGEWGKEIYARTGGAASVFIGVDGPRWMLYGVATGPMENHDALDAELRRMLRATVVVRGRAPYPPRTVLPLVMPPELAEQQATAEPSPGTPEAVVMSTAVETGEPAPGATDGAPVESETQPVPMAPAPPYAFPAARPRPPAPPPPVPAPAPAGAAPVRPSPSSEELEATIAIRRIDPTVPPPERPAPPPTAPAPAPQPVTTVAPPPPTSAPEPAASTTAAASTPTAATSSGAEYVGRRRKPEPSTPDERVAERGKHRKPEPADTPAATPGSQEYVGRRRKPEPDPTTPTGAAEEEEYVGRRRAPEDGTPALTVQELTARLRAETEPQHAPSNDRPTVSVAELLARHPGLAEAARRGGGRHRRPEAEQPKP